MEFIKIVFFTEKSLYDAELLKYIKDKNIEIELNIIEIPKAKSYLRKLERSLKKKGLAKTLRTIFNFSINIKPFKPSDEWFSNDFYTRYSKKVLIVDDFNGAICESILREVSPDLIVLGCTRIIRERILNIPSIGIINAHPGLLPKYRGIDTIPWAIYNGDDIGVTVHFIDEGIDTGGVLSDMKVSCCTHPFSLICSRSRFAGDELL